MDVEEKERHEVDWDAAEGLPRVDGGWPAWRFVLCGHVLDMFTWGMTFAWSRYQVSEASKARGRAKRRVCQAYYTTHPPFENDNQVVIAVTGSLQLALLYAGLLVGTQMTRRWPHHAQKGMWASMIAYQLSLVIASFATNVAMIIVFQGFFASLFSTLAYAPLYLYLSEWWIKWRATAGAIIFAGAGLGGAIFPIVRRYCFQTARADTERERS